MSDNTNKKDKLIEYVIGEIDAEDISRIQAAMEVDPEIRLTVNRLGGAADAIKNAASAKPPPGFDDRFWQKVVAETTVPGADQPSLRPTPEASCCMVDRAQLMVCYRYHG